MPEQTLMQLAEVKFPDLSESERNLVECVAAGKEWDRRVGEELHDDSANAMNWEPVRALRAALIAWLCLDAEARKHVTDWGIHVIGARIEGKLNVSYADFGKPLFLVVCSIADGLDCRDAHFKLLNLTGSHVGSVTADGLKVTGSVFLQKGFTAKGEVRLSGASIGWNLSCIDGTFLNVDGDALIADGVDVKGSVFLNGNFSARGAVRFSGADIGGDLSCVGGTFENVNGKAFSADGAKILGSVFMREECTFHGRVSLVEACVENHFQWYRVKDVEAAKLDLRGAQVGTVWIGVKQGAKDQYPDMPHKNQCWLDGFTYNFIFEQMATDSEWWIEFIERQQLDNPRRNSEKTRGLLRRGALWLCNTLPSSWGIALALQIFGEDVPFVPQPYEQAAKRLREHGHVEAAHEVLIAKEQRRKKTIPLIGDFTPGAKKGRWEAFKLFASLSMQWLWYRTGAPMIGYGHRPVYALMVSVLVILFGWGVFWVGDAYGHMVPLTYWPTPTTLSASENESLKLVYDPAPPQHPHFSPFMFSMETFLPLIPLQQEEFWHPEASTWAGWWLRAYAWVQTLFGWFVTTVLLAAVSGIVKQ